MGKILTLQVAFNLKTEEEWRPETISMTPLKLLIAKHSFFRIKN